MKYQAENAVSSFFYYMWNAWSKEECKAVFGDMYRHFWDKWSALADKSIFGAAERFFAELSENNQKLLVERAVTLSMTAGLSEKSRTIPTSLSVKNAVHGSWKSKHG